MAQVLANFRRLPSDAPPFLTEDNQSDIADDGGSNVGSKDGSMVSSLIKSNSVVGSTVTDSKISGLTGANYSAFTAPPRYRNSGVFVHGTKFRNFKSIMEHGLKAAKSEIFMIDEVRPDGRVPGLRDPPQILIFIDEEKARSERMEFEYDGAQGTWRTKGINGVIRPWFFQKVVDQRMGPGRGNVLFQSKEDPMMKANVIKGKQRPKYLIHATFWENLSGILEEGIVPAKNPTSELRRPFRDLLQGAESHIYTSRVPSGIRAVSSTVPSSPVFRFQPADRPAEDQIGTQRARSGSVSLLEGALKPLEENGKVHAFTLEKDAVGLDRLPDAFVVIDTEKAEKLGLELDMVQSADREETVFVKGPVPPEAFVRVEVNEPVDLPESLRAKIVDPRSFSDIPVIDISQDDDELVEQFKYACEVVGFFQVIGHGVSLELQERLLDAQRDFFSLPESIKAKYELNDEVPVRGYFGRGGEDLDSVSGDQVDAAGKQKIRQVRTDKKEGLDTNGVPWSKPIGGYIAEIFAHSSRLPTEEEVPGMKETCEEYAQEMFRISKRILSIMARVLGKQPDFFDQYLTAPVATHRMLHYWPLEDFTKEIGVGEHTDYGLITVLKQDSVGGLQVLNAKDNKWVHACPLHDAFVVNIGDMIARWTNHRFKSTVHRVVNLAPVDRYSVPYFLEPNLEAVIKTGALLEPEEATSAPSSESAEDFPTAEEILERFYRASGQLKKHGK